MVNAGRGDVDVLGNCRMDQTCGQSWDALIQVLSGTTLRGHHTKQRRAWMHTESIFQQPLCGKAKPIKRFPVTVILQQGFALHHFPFAMSFFCLHKRIPWQKAAASWPDLAKGLTEAFSSTPLHQQNCLFKEKS